jgi:signal peptidase I
MATTKNPVTKEKDAKKSQADDPPHDGIRETIESIVIAFVLAFLFRTFEAEAFVIPTGSMAPTLMGQHKDVECTACKFPYRVNASSEEQQRPEIVRSSVCPNCGFRMPVDNLLSFKGDRLLVSKFPYELADPKRWDVVVFKFPGKAKNNYIKRLVGLPNETVVITHGDIYTGANPLLAGGKTEIQRKPPDKVRAMLQVVYDNDYVLNDWIKAGWPASWTAADGKSAGDWTASEDHKSFSVDKKEGGRAWLRYRHIAPSPDVWPHIWQDFEAGQLTENDLQLARPRGVQDLYAYNNGIPQRSSSGIPSWVGDLAVECELKAEGKNGVVILQLVKGGRHFECRLDLATGAAELSIPGLNSFQPKSQKAFEASQNHRVMFANVDEQLLLWIDDKLVAFDAETTYSSLNNYVETVEDGSPVGIAVEGTSARVEHLRVLRDIYYTDVGRARGPLPLDEDQFLMLGDNSPQSLDSRLWESENAQGNPEYYVHRDLLIGKAIYIYWPHACVPEWAAHVDAWGGQIGIPFYPNFWRMGLVR